MEKMATVFYVDDNPKSRRLLTSILEERGFEVISADNPVEALDRADELDFDLALLGRSRVRECSLGSWCHAG